MYRKLVQTAPLGVADGPTRMTYEHLWYLNAFSTYKTIPKLQEVVFDLLADSCNKMVCGRMPQEVFTFFASSRALIFAKKGTPFPLYRLQFDNHHEAYRIATLENFHQWPSSLLGTAVCSILSFPCSDTGLLFHQLSPFWRISMLLSLQRK